jgi:hypothetical protein
MKTLLTIVNPWVLVVGLVLTMAQTADAQYSQTILKDKPVAYYRLGESAGSTLAVDSSPNGFNGAYEGSPQLGVLGLINDPNTAVDFSNGDVAIDDQPGLDFVSVPFSIEGGSTPHNFPRLLGEFLTKCPLATVGQAMGLM